MKAIISGVMLLCFSSFISSCSNASKDESSSVLLGTWQNDAGYNLEVLKTNKKIGDSTWFNVSFLEKNDEVFDYGVTLKYACTEMEVDNGSIQFKINNGTTGFRMEVSSFGHYSIQTEPRMLHENDSIVINFIMAEEDRPFYNCPPKLEQAFDVHRH